MEPLPLSHFNCEGTQNLAQLAWYEAAFSESRTEDHGTGTPHSALHITASTNGSVAPKQSVWKSLVWGNYSFITFSG